MRYNGTTCAADGNTTSRRKIYKLADGHQKSRCVPTVVFRRGTTSCGERDARRAITRRYMCGGTGHATNIDYTEICLAPSQKDRDRLRTNGKSVKGALMTAEWAVRCVRSSPATCMEYLYQYSTARKAKSSPQWQHVAAL